MNKTNRHMPVIKIPGRLVRQIYTSFAQNILGKYGIGRWKSQFPGLILRNGIITGEEKETRRGTQIKIYSGCLKLYKYINNLSVQTKLAGNTRILCLKPLSGCTWADNHLNLSAYTGIIQHYYSEKAGPGQNAILKPNQTKQYFRQSYTAKTVSVFKSFSNNMERRTGTAADHAARDGVYPRYVPDMGYGREFFIPAEAAVHEPQTEQAVYKEPEHTYRRIFEEQISHKEEYVKNPIEKYYKPSLTEFLKNKLIREEKYDYLLKRNLTGELKLDEIQKFNTIQKLNAVQKLSGKDIIYSTQKKVFQRGVHYGEVNKSNVGAAGDFAHFTPRKHNGLNDIDLVFYKPQSGEMKIKIPELKEDRQKDIIIGDKEVYAKAFTPQKPDKKLKSPGAEEVNMLAEKVFKIIEKRLAIQKDRRGLR